MGIPGNPEEEDWSMLDWSGEKAELDLMLAELGLTPAVAEAGAGCSPHTPAWAW